MSLMEMENGSAALGNSLVVPKNNKSYHHCRCSVTKSCPTPSDSMDCSRPGFPVLHYLLEFAQIHVH